MESDGKQMYPMAPPPPAPYYQPQFAQQQQQPQVSYGMPQSSGYVPVQQATVNIVGSGATTLSPSNDCVICLSVFACVCCSMSMGSIALALALVAKVFHPDPANATKAVTLNRYAFRFAMSAILVGVTFIIVIAIIYGSAFSAMISMLSDMNKKQQSQSSGGSYTMRGSSSGQWPNK